MSQRWPLRSIVHLVPTPPNKHCVNWLYVHQKSIIWHRNQGKTAHFVILLLQGAIFWVPDFLGSGFWELFWISQYPLFWRANFPEPLRISQNPKKASVSAQAQNTTRRHRVVLFTQHTACLRKRRTQHESRVVLLALRGSCYVKNTTTLFCRWRGVDGPQLTQSNFEFYLILLASFILKNLVAQGSGKFFFFQNP
jgi:hypothetical protein